MKVLNAFSLSMLPAFPAAVEVTEISAARAAEIIKNGMSYIGHASTCSLIGSTLGVEPECRRESVRLATGETALVVQYAGPRLPEGATELPEGAALKFILVRVGQAEVGCPLCGAFNGAG
jgi:hypothetical protein